MKFSLSSFISIHFFVSYGMQKRVEINKSHILSLIFFDIEICVLKKSKVSMMYKDT